MLEFILRLLVPSYFEYQEEMERQINFLDNEIKKQNKSLEGVNKNER